MSMGDQLDTSPPRETARCKDQILLYDYKLSALFDVYCCPSGFSELRPARKISSVDNKLTAMTELDHVGEQKIEQ